MKKIYAYYYLFIKLIGLLFLLFFVFIQAGEKNPLKFSHELIRKNKIDSAIVFLKQEISKSKLDVNDAFFFIELGNAYKLKQQYEKSFQAYQSSLRIFKEKKLLQDEFFVYTQLAEFYRYRRLYKSAENQLKICEKILKKKNVKDVYLMRFYSRKAA